jgi:hypothetical protein
MSNHDDYLRTLVNTPRAVGERGMGVVLADGTLRTWRPHESV